MAPTWTLAPFFLVMTSLEPLLVGCAAQVSCEAVGADPEGCAAAVDAPHDAETGLEEEEREGAEEAALLKVVLLQTSLRSPVATSALAAGRQMLLAGQQQEQQHQQQPAGTQNEAALPGANVGTDASMKCAPNYAPLYLDPAQNCAYSRCCQDPRATCYEKGPSWAGCLYSCVPGVHYDEQIFFWTPWSCRVLSATTATTSAAPSASVTSATTAPAPGSPTTLPAVPPTQGGYSPRDPALLKPSTAPLLSFYIYRAWNDQEYPLENANAANLAGVLWYLQNEVVINPWLPKFGITRIKRYVLKTRATQPLSDRGMNFGVRYAFDSGKCTGPFDCNTQWTKYGYFVGCNNLGSFPFPTYKVPYNGGIWYSLPGPCPSRVFTKHDAACTAAEPGGQCTGDPTGRGDCTWSVEPAGELRLSELQGWLGISFWMNSKDEGAANMRLKAGEDAWRAKYPNSPILPSPSCDFDMDKFYDEGIPEA